VAISWKVKGISHSMAHFNHQIFSE
jgi:hypothetical protein